MIKKLKRIFHCYAGPLNLDDLYDLDDITVKVSEKITFTKNNYKYFNGYSEDDYDIYQFLIALP